MSPTSQARPTKPNTTYATDTQDNAGPIVEDIDAFLERVDEVLRGLPKKEEGPWSST